MSSLRERNQSKLNEFTKSFKEFEKVLDKLEKLSIIEKVAARQRQAKAAKN